MGRNFKEAAGAGVLDYLKQPLPLFGIYANYNNSSYGLNVYDSDFQYVTGSGGAFNPYNGEFTNNWAYFMTQGNNGSGGVSSYWGKATPATGVDGNSVIVAGYDGGFTLRPADYQGVHQYFGVVVGPEGYRQNYSLYNSGLIVRQHARGLPFVYDQVDLTGKFTPLASSLGSSGVALIGYNRNLGTLVWLELGASDGTKYRVHTWKNLKRKLTGRPGELNNLVTEAFASANGASYSFYDVTVAYSVPNNMEGRSGRVIPTNDGRIAFTRMYPSSSHQFMVFAPPAANTQTPGVGTSTNKGVVATTTSYGREQGPQYGVRHNITWDNKWIATYCPYYYYAAGVCAFFINADNPDLWYNLQYGSSADGVQFLPRGRSGFAVNYADYNSDSGRGATLGHLDFGPGLINGVAAPAVGGAVTVQFVPYYFDTAYTSTQYPCIVPIERWTSPGAISNVIEQVA